MAEFFIDDYQWRVADECVQLSEKIKKLEAFMLTNPRFLELKDADRDLLVTQHAAMRTYEGILNMRIARFNQ